MSKNPSAKNTASNTQSSATIHPFKPALIARQLLAMLGDADTVTLFHRNDEGKRDGLVTKSITDIAAAIHEARDLAGDHHVFAALTGLRLAFKDKASANAADLPDPSYVLNGPGGSIHLVYLMKPSDRLATLLGKRRKSDTDDAYTDDVPLAYGKYGLHADDAAALEADKDFKVWTVEEFEAKSLPAEEDEPESRAESTIPGTVGSLDDEPTERINDAEVYGVISDDIWKKKLFVSTAKKREDKYFKVSPELSFSDILVSNLSKIRVGQKDGNCFVPGVLVEGRRLNNAVTKLYMMGLDVDSGANMEDTIRKLQTMGLFFVAYTTHSHGTTTLEIKKDKFFKWATDNGHPSEASVETVKLFLTDEGKYTDDVIASVSDVNTSHETSGIQLIVTTRPIDKFRLLFVLEKPYVIAEQEGAQKDAIRAWGDMILGMGSLLGISVDRSARDCSRLFYSPSKAKGSTSARVIVSAGKALDWRSLPRVDVAGLMSSDPFDQAANIMGGRIRGRTMSPQKGLDLQKWASERAHGFQISSVFRNHCDDRLRGETGPGKFTCECPFDDDHSNAGNPDDPGCFIQDAGLDAESFTFRCSHDSCAPHDRLAMLEKAMVDGWFTDDVLTDPAYDISGADEVEDGEGQDDDDAADPDAAATRLLGLDALIKKATAEKASGNVVAAATMEALMNCLARQKSRVPIYDRIRSLKLTGITDFKREVESRAKVFAREAEAKERLKAGEGMPGEDRHYPSLADGIRAMNEEIALVQRGSGVVFYEKRETDEPWLSLEAAPVVYRPWTYGKEFEPLFPAWVASSYRDHRTEIVFNPYVHRTRDLTPANHLNLYRGLALTPVEGDCMDYYRHVFHIICGGNMRFFKYVMTWLAQMMQQPDRKPGTALVLRGLKGIGKGIFVDALRPILGRHSVKVSDPKQLTGNFNGHMDAKILAIAEEAFFGGDRKIDSIVKDMITSDMMMLERKFMDATEIGDYRRFIFLSNAENVVRATPDERRYAMTLVNPEEMHNRAYWDHFAARIGGGRLPAALAYDLLRLDRDKIGVDLRTPPRTAALMDQILIGQNAEDQWLRGVLTSGTFLDVNGASLITEPKKLELWKTEPLTVPKDTIYESYRSEVSTYYGKEVSAEKIGTYLLGMFKETENGNSLIGVEGNGVTGRSYVLPPLPDLRAFYEDHHLPLNHRTVDDEADFIRVAKPQVAMYPLKPQTDDAFALAAHRLQCEVFEEERAEVRAEADEFIRKTLG
ncbi:MAG: hypothetical protein EOS26_10375 [Mesorhizobium sp.]|nr:MAG: hypothetical protein EOS26_10375 [Mesorhizobium sp.]